MVDTNCRELIFFPEPCLKCIEKGNFGRVPIAAKESGTKSLHHLFSSIPHHSGLIDNWKNIAKTLCINRKFLFGSIRSYSLKIWEDFHFLGAKKFITHSRSLCYSCCTLLSLWSGPNKYYKKEPTVRASCAKLHVAI